MDKEDLEKTKCLDEDVKTLKQAKEIETLDIAETREEKYKEIHEELSEDLSDAIIDENGDVIENPDPIVETSDTEETKEEKKLNIFQKIAKKWKGLSKPKKIIFISIFIILVVAIIIGIVYLCSHKKEEIIDTPVEDVVVVKDNYIYRNGTLYFLDSNDNEIGSYECNNKDENMCYIPYNNLESDNFAKTINTYEDGSTLQERLKIYFDTYAFIYDSSEENASISLYNIKEKKITDNYKEIRAYENDNVSYFVAKNELDCYVLYEIHTDGTSMKINNNYQYMGMINGGVVAKNSKGYQLLNLDGSTIAKNIDDTIVNWNENYIVTKVNDNYNLVDYNDTEKFKDYKYIDLENDMILLIDSKNILTIRGSDSRKYLEDGIQLTNEFYEKVNVYDENGKKLNDKQAYLINVNSNLITVTIPDSTGVDSTSSTNRTINTDEAEYNTTLEYYNYFDGKLYFYSDQEKETKIGSYTCDNKNESFTKGELLNNCRPALDTIFEENDMYTDTGRISMIPIINNKYVFIEDSTTNNKNVKLYDLTTSQSTSTYEAVNTYTKGNNGVLGLSTTPGVEVVVKNKNNKFGMLKVGNSVTKVYGFEYGYMEMLDTKLLVLNGNNKWQLLYSINSSSVEFEGKIRGFVGNISYFKVKQNNKYYVYDSNGKLMLETGFKYVELYSSMFAGVDDNNQLMVYDYNGNKLISDNVQLYSTTYYGSQSNSFIIATSGNEINIEVYKDNDYITNKYEMLKISNEE